MNIAPKNTDFQVSQPPTDAVTALAFSKHQDFLAASSFDGQTRIYQVQPNGSSIPKSSIQHEGMKAAMSCCWSSDGSKVFSVGGDGQGKMIDLATGAVQQVCAHDGVIRSVSYIDGLPNMNNMLVTGSWDKTAKYWDLRSPNPAHILSLPERCYALDVKGTLMVIATAGRHVQIYNLNNPSIVYKTLASPLKMQTRCVGAFIDSTGFAIGSIEGRVGIQYVEDKDQSLNFSFKCHRDEKPTPNVYPVNSLAFHPTYGTFSSAGGDGTYYFWDKDSKQRLKSSAQVGGPITASTFNRNGSIFAYSVGYDWHKGVEGAQPNMKYEIYLNPTKDEDIKPKPKGTKR